MDSEALKELSGIERLLRKFWSPKNHWVAEGNGTSSARVMSKTDEGDLFPLLSAGTGPGTAELAQFLANAPIFIDRLLRAVKNQMETILGMNQVQEALLAEVAALKAAVPVVPTERNVTVTVGVTPDGGLSFLLTDPHGNEEHMTKVLAEQILSRLSRPSASAKAGTEPMRPLDVRSSKGGGNVIALDVVGKGITLATGTPQAFELNWLTPEQAQVLGEELCWLAEKKKE